MQSHPYVFSVNENDGLPLEYKLEEWRPGRYLDVKDIVNNPAPFCFDGPNEGGLKKQLLSFVRADLGVTYNDVAD